MTPGTTKTTVQLGSALSKTTEALPWSAWEMCSGWVVLAFLSRHALQHDFILIEFTPHSSHI